jgi:hypothetical protein
MKTIGIWLMMVAVLLLLHSCTMDVTIPTASGGSVVNFHMLSKRANAQNCGTFFGVVGALFLVFGAWRAAKQKALFDKASGKIAGVPATRKCLYCAGKNPSEAIKCEHCQADLTQPTTH